MKKSVKSVKSVNKTRSQFMSKEMGIFFCAVFAAAAVSCIPPIGTKDYNKVEEYETNVYVSWSGVGESSSERSAGSARGVIWVGDAAEAFTPNDAYTYYDNHFTTMNNAFGTLFEKTPRNARLVPKNFDSNKYDADASYRAEVDAYRVAKYEYAVGSVENYWSQFDENGGEIRGDIEHRQSLPSGEAYGTIIAKIGTMEGLIGGPVSTAPADQVYNNFEITDPAIETYYKGLASVWLSPLRGPIAILPLN
jgi:hypothetical protein